MKNIYILIALVLSIFNGFLSHLSIIKENYNIALFHAFACGFSFCVALLITIDNNNNNK